MNWSKQAILGYFWYKQVRFPVVSDHGLNKNTSRLFTSFYFHVQQTRGSIDVIVIAFYSPSCLGQETAKRLFGLRVKLPPVYHMRWRLQTVPFNAEPHVMQESCQYQFLVFDLTRPGIAPQFTISVADALYQGWAKLFKKKKAACGKP